MYLMCVTFYLYTYACLKIKLNSKQDKKRERREKFFTILYPRMKVYFINQLFSKRLYQLKLSFLNPCDLKNIKRAMFSFKCYNRCRSLTYVSFIFLSKSTLSNPDIIAAYLIEQEICEVVQSLISSCNMWQCSHRYNQPFRFECSHVRHWCINSNPCN